MERLNLEIVHALAASGSLAVAGPQGCTTFLPAHTVVRESPIRPLVRFFLSTLLSACRLARRSKPELVVAGSGLCAPFAWLAARLAGARFAVYVHGLDLVADSSAYRLGWLPFIRRGDVCIVNSANTGRLAVLAGVDPARVRIVHPGVAVHATGASPEACTGYLRRRGWVGRRILLSVGRLTERKGLLAFVDEALPQLVKQDPGILLAVIGNDAPDALRRGQVHVRTAVEARVAEAGLSGHVEFLGEVDDAELTLAYAVADVAVFPVRTMPGDVEGFGMVAIEAASRGLPTVAFSSGGVPDAVCEGTSGRLVDEGDYDSLVVAITEVLAGGRTSWSDGCRAFAAGFSWERFAEQLRGALGPAP